MNTYIWEALRIPPANPHVPSAAAGVSRKARDSWARWGGSLYNKRPVHSGQLVWSRESSCPSCVTRVVALGQEDTGEY